MVKGDLYKEVGRYFFNLSLLVIGGLLLKKFAEGQILLWEALSGLILSMASFFIGITFFKKGIKNDDN